MRLRDRECQFFEVELTNQPTNLGGNEWRLTLALPCLLFLRCFFRLFFFVQLGKAFGHLPFVKFFCPLTVLQNKSFIYFRDKIPSTRNGLTTYFRTVVKLKGKLFQKKNITRHFYIWVVYYCGIKHNRTNDLQWSVLNAFFPQSFNQLV